MIMSCVWLPTIDGGPNSMTEWALRAAPHELAQGLFDAAVVATSRTAGMYRLPHEEKSKGNLFSWLDAWIRNRPSLGRATRDAARAEDDRRLDELARQEEVFVDGVLGQRRCGSRAGMAP